MLDPNVNWKKVWVLVFCSLSLFTCLFFVPYNVLGYKDKPTGDVEYMSAFHTEVDYHYKYKLQVDYQAVAFRELIILLACAGGYSFSTMRKK